MQNSLAGRNVIVTGANAGLGLETSKVCPEQLPGK